MNGNAKALTSTAALLVALVLASGCGGDADEPQGQGAATTEQAQETTTDGETAPAPPPPPPPPPGPARLAVTVRDGAVVGGVRRLSVDRGSDVLFVVRADVSDHVHLHGYDLLTDVAPGRPGRIRFTADMPGSFEAELEDRALHIAVLRVRR